MGGLDESPQESSTLQQLSAQTVSSVSEEAGGDSRGLVPGSKAWDSGSGASAPSEVGGGASGSGASAESCERTDPSDEMGGVADGELFVRRFKRAFAIGRALHFTCIKGSSAAYLGYRFRRRISPPQPDYSAMKAVRTSNCTIPEAPRQDHSETTLVGTNNASCCRNIDLRKLVRELGCTTPHTP